MNRLFEAASPMKLLMQHVQQQPIPPSHRTEQRIPGDVDDFVMACLHKDPEGRPRTADELFRLASACTTDEWNQDAARDWWDAHLPQFAGPERADCSYRGSLAAITPMGVHALSGSRLAASL
jgi:hypothetical protein